MNDHEPFTLTMRYVPSRETWEEYALRCTDVANYAAQRSAHLSGPTAFDVSDTTKFRRISETAYEVISPDREQPEPSKPERDTHFQGFSGLLFPEISQLFFTMYARIEEHRPIEELDAIEDEIKTLLAQSGYDLVFHTFKHTDDLYLDMGGYKDLPSDDTVIENMKQVPDLTEWPTIARANAGE